MQLLAANFREWEAEKIRNFIKKNPNAYDLERIAYPFKAIIDGRECNSRGYIKIR